MRQELLLYMFAVHGGHTALFERYRGTVNRLNILGADFLQDYDGHHKIISAIDPELLAMMIRGLGYFEKVRVVGLADIPELNQSSLIMSDESVSRPLMKRYFPDAVVEYSPVFLQWNKEKVFTNEVVNYDASVSNEDFDRFVFEQAYAEANQSSDWWRHVGGVVVKDGKVIFAAHNTHLPHEHMPYLFGDPRVFVEAGQHPEICSAIHGEQAIIAEAARRVLEGASLYTTTYPCPVCAKMIGCAGIKKVYFREGHASLDGQTVLQAFGVEVIHVETV